MPISKLLGRHTKCLMRSTILSREMNFLSRPRDTTRLGTAEDCPASVLGVCDQVAVRWAKKNSRGP